MAATQPVPAPSPSDQAPAAAAPAVYAAHLTKLIDNRPVLRDLDFQIPAGQFVAILGPNGAGKTTLLHVLASLCAVTAGELRLFGRTPRHHAALRRGIGMIGHQSMLYRDLSARENLMFFGRLYGVASPRQRADDLLHRVGLAHRADDSVKTFSRGMVQRAAIARALMHDPQLLLADEPFAGLDVAASAALEKLLTDLHAEGRTVLLVNHDVPQSLRLAERLLVLRAGRITLDAPTPSLTESDLLAEITA